MIYRIGQGIDFHKLKKNETLQEMKLGGIEIPTFYSIIAHSDGDIVIHSLSDAILGACGESDIGSYFPDTDPANKNLNSVVILEKSLEIMNSKGYIIENIDITIITEEPKIAPYREKIKNHLAILCKINNDQISIKATTTEKLGFIGKKEGIACFTNVLIKKI